MKSSGAAATSQGAAGDDQPVETCPLKSRWIELELVGQDDKPVVNERYVVVVTDSAERKGKTDTNGFARVAGFPEGKCKIPFPDLDEKSYEALGVV